MELIETLKAKPNISRQDIADLLASIGEPGEKRGEKIAAVNQLGKTNTQGHELAQSLGSYVEY